MGLAIVIVLAGCSSGAGPIDGSEEIQETVESKDIADEAEAVVSADVPLDELAHDIVAADVSLEVEVVPSFPSLPEGPGVIVEVQSEVPVRRGSSCCPSVRLWSRGVCLTQPARAR